MKDKETEELPGLVVRDGGGAEEVDNESDTKAGDDPLGTLPEVVVFKN